MSIRIVKNGILDTIQDGGRYGYQHLGINPGGAMDQTAMKLVNALVGNKETEAVLEMHFPATEIVFEKKVLFAIGGGDFGATINHETVPLHQPIVVQAGTLLQFKRNITGARVYLAIEGGFAVNEWLNSCSTHLLVNAGGYYGRPLQKNDLLPFQKYHEPDIFSENTPFTTLPWRAKITDFYVSNQLHFISGAEYDYLEEPVRNLLASTVFTITKQSNRMGYRLHSNPLVITNRKELISSAVTKGTIQLLPDGQLIILMADHQTTGGYPRIGHIISAEFSSLAQMRVGEKFTLKKTDLFTAEKLLLVQQRNLLQVQNACNFHLQSKY